MTQKIKNYASALLIASLSIIAVSCSKDKSAPKSDPKTVVNAQSQTNKQLTVCCGADEFSFLGLYKVERKPVHNGPPANAWFPSETTPVMRIGEKLLSPNGLYALNFQTDGNLVLSNTTSGAVLWSIKQKDGTYLMFHKDGNLIMHTANGYNWTSDIYVARQDYQGTGLVYLTLQDDGNFVMEWDGTTYTDVVGSTATGGGINSSHYGSLKIPW